MEMALELRAAKNRRAQLKARLVDKNVDAVEEMTMTYQHQERSFYDKVYDGAERFAATRIGQFVIERGDRLLSIVEDTAKWSLPQDKTECKLKRPLSWLPFLALIIALRLVRIWLSVAALLIGDGPIMPDDVVYFVQTRRRKLRSIRSHGKKAIRARELEALAAKSNGVSLLAKFKQLLSLAICRPGRYTESISSTPITQNEKQQTTDKRQRHSDGEEDANLTCEQLLSKYANDDSDNDSDFVPDPREDKDTDDSTSQDSSSDEETHNKEQISDTESHAQNRNNSTDAEVIEMDITPKSKTQVKIDSEAYLDSGSDPMWTPKENGPSQLDTAQQYPTPQGNAASHGNANAASSIESHHSTPTSKVHPSKANFSKEELQKTTRGLPSLNFTAVTALLTKSEDITETPISYPKTTNPNDSTTDASDTTETDNSNTTPTNLITKSNSTVSSASSLASFVTSEDLVLSNEKAAYMSESASTPTPRQTNCETLSSASSTEDLFYSPIGSPPDFKSCMPPRVSILKTSQPQSSPNEGMHSSSKGAEFTPQSEQPATASITVPEKHVQYELQRPSQSHSNQPHHNRHQNRRKNRR